jgi:WD40 repeat protein
MRGVPFHDSRMTRDHAGTVQSCVVGRSRFRVVCLRLLAFLLLGVFLLPWLPASVLAPGPMRVAAGKPDIMTTRFAFSPDGVHLATVQTDGHSAMWDVTRGWRITRTLDHCAYARVPAFSTDGRWLAVGGLGPDIILYDRNSDTWDHPSRIPLCGVTSLAFSLNSRILAASSNLDRDILLWDVVAGRARARLRGHNSSVLSLAMAPDGCSLASGGYSDGEIIIWDLASCRPRLRIEVSGNPVVGLAYSPDGSLLASTSLCEMPVRLWETKSGCLVRRVGTHTATASANAVAFSREGRMLALVNGSGRVEIWSATTGQKLGCLDTPRGRIRGVAFSPDGTTLVATGLDNDLRIWKLSDLPSAETEAKPLSERP